MGNSNELCEWPIRATWAEHAGCESMRKGRGVIDSVYNLCRYSPQEWSQILGSKFAWRFGRRSRFKVNLLPHTYSGAKNKTKKINKLKVLKK